MRKFMTKEVTSTNVKVGKIEVVEGVPTVIELPVMVLLGDIANDKAQKEAEKLHGVGVAVFALETITQKYKMKVEDFIKVAELVADGEEEEEEEDDEEEKEEESSSKITIKVGDKTEEK